MFKNNAIHKIDITGFI
ncbi:hypothetical protein ECPA3_3104, partial [Escherichia coli PA3]